MDYRGINYAPMTRDMGRRLKDMPLAHIALAQFRMLVGEGNSIQLYGGCRGWARWLECSPAYSKKILDRLDSEGFLRVTYLSQGFADVDVLPVVAPTEQADDAPRLPSDRERYHPKGRVVPPQTADSERSLRKQIRHESCTKQQQRAAPLFSDSNQEKLYCRLMSQATMHEPTAKAIAQNAPGSLSDFEADLLAASTRPGIENPFWLTVAAWMRQSRISARKPHATPDLPQPDRSTRPAGTGRRSTSRELTPGGVTPNWPEQSEIDRINAEYHAEKERRRLARLSAVQGARDATDGPADAATPARADDLSVSGGCASPGAGGLSALSVCPV